MRGTTTSGGAAPGANPRATTLSLRLMTSRSARTAFLVLLLAAVGVAGAAPAAAHNYVVGSSPAAGAVVTEQPGVFTVSTNDLLLDLGGTGSASAMVITGPESAPLFYGDGCSTVSGVTVQSEAQLGAPGQYTVIWQTVSTDGHSISDEFTFQWEPAPGQVLAEGAPSAPSCGTDADAVPTESDTSPPAEAAPRSGGSGALSTIAWVGGTLGAVVLAVGATLLLLRRSSRP